MSLNLICEVWDAMRNHIDFNDRSQAAAELVDLLIDDGYEADEIKDAFRGSKEIITAVKEYLDVHESEEFNEDFDEFDDEDEEW